MKFYLRSIMQSTVQQQRLKSVKVLFSLVEDVNNEHVTRGKRGKYLLSKVEKVSIHSSQAIRSDAQHMLLG